jgi:predicted small lipoprotein YifL
MKKVLSVILMFTLLLSMASCGTTDTGNSALPSTASNLAEEQESEVEEAPTIEEDEVVSDFDEEEVPAAEELDPQESQYQEAVSLAQDGSYAEAVAELRELGDYKDSAILSKEFAYAAVRSYIQENGEPFALTIEEFRDSFDSYDYAISMPYNDVASIVMALDESENIVFSLVNEGGQRTDSGSLGSYLGECFSMTLEEGINQADFSVMSVITVLGAYTLEYGKGEIDITTHTLDTTLTLEDGYKKIRTVNGEESEIENATAEDMSSVETMLEETVNERMLATIEDKLEEIGLSLYDLGFTAMVPYSAENSDAAEATTEAATSAGGSVSGETIDLTLETGRAVYKDWSYLPDGFLADDSYDPSNGILVNFDYTNLEDDEKTMSSDFWVRAYQNGVELDYAFCSYYSNVLETAENMHKNVLNGGTITVGWWFYLTDKSPVTIIVSENGGMGDNKQSMVIDLE